MQAARLLSGPLPSVYVSSLGQKHTLRGASSSPGQTRQTSITLRGALCSSGTTSALSRQQVKSDSLQRSSRRRRSSRQPTCVVVPVSVRALAEVFYEARQLRKPQILENGTNLSRSHQLVDAD